MQLAILLGHRSYGRYGTEESCDIACRFCYWLLAIEDYPHEFSRPAKHPYPLNYRVVIYIQHIGVGVCVGHAWQEGKIKEGKKILDTFDWEHTIYIQPLLEKDKKKTLGVYGIPLKDIYLNNMARLKPPRSCDLQNMDHLCKNCYYFLRVEKFFD
ncbi:hypothetical protein Bca52824_077776 [Brassica carinata]|uniref:Uncharacterized protein n=1 Tax=Brassica carinata TaxID=52824 RepID=A0A8X7TXY0_BRACI|nr:hypothetical protein Bca52824_077776 [Brassica carinata]